MQKTIEFSEPLFYYSQDDNLWEERSQINIFLNTCSSFQKKFDLNAPILSIKANNDLPNSQSLFISQDYEFHYYPKKTFLCEKDFKGTLISRSLNIPCHIIVLSKKEIDVEGDLTIYFEIFGCNCSANNSKEQISLTLAKLYYEVRYSHLGIMHQAKERIEMILLSCFKDIVRYIYSIEKLPTAASTAEFLFYLLKKKEDMKVEDIPDIRSELESLVYKSMISEGIFPIHCEINTMNTNVIQLALSSLFIPDSILPWSPKFHASFSIGNFHYSFNPNNRMNTKKMKVRTYHSNFFYVRIKILDFFPLNAWIKQIAGFFHKNLVQILLNIKARNIELLGEEEEALEIPKENLEGLYKTQEVDSFVKRENLKQPLLKKKNYLGNFFSKKKNGESGEKKEKGKFGSFRKNLKGELLKNILNDFPEAEEISLSIAFEFYDNYKFELTNTQILWNICKIIARTELRQYETLSNNCQTPVAESLHIIHEKLKQFIEPLQEKKDFLIHSKKIQNEYFKFQSKITRLMNENKIIKPMVLDCNLDYFGIYADKYLQVYLENLKKVTVFEDFKKVNDKISFREKNIQVLFQNFGTVYRTVFENIKSVGSFNNFTSDDKLSSFRKELFQVNTNDLIKFNDQTRKKTITEEIVINDPLLKLNSKEFIDLKQNNPDKNLKSNNMKQQTFFSPNKYQSFTNKSPSSFTIGQDIIKHAFPNNTISPNDLFQANGNNKDLKKKPTGKKDEKINRALSYFLFMCENIIYNYKIQISLSKDSEESRLLKLKKYELLNLYREFSYYYFNSIRLKNSSKLNKNNISYVGFLLIKDPEKVLVELPENSKEIYASAYM